MRFQPLIGAFFIFCAAAWQPVGAQAKKSTAPAKARSSKVAAPKRIASASPNSQSTSSESVEVVNPGVFLLRDPLIQAELQLTAAQRVDAAALASEFNESIWRFRDASIESDVARKEARLVNALVDPRLDQLLNTRQRERLTGIILQIQGTSALSYSSTAQKLSLSSEQQEKISKLSAGAKTSLDQLKEQATGSKNVADLNRQAEKLQTALQRDLQAVLTKSQLDRWIELRGSAFDVSKLQPLTAQAPELRGVNDWINSEPLTLEAQRGKVVVLHFWTFG
jgi:hypothetical protein